MRTQLRKVRPWILLNLLAAGTYLWLASSRWFEPDLLSETGIQGGAGSAWVVTTLPVLLACLAADLIWLGRSIHQSAQEQKVELSGLIPATAIAMLWVAVISLDISLH